MKKNYYVLVLLFLTLVFALSTLSYAAFPDKKAGKHKSHKKAKKKVSPYFHNFQH